MSRFALLLLALAAAPAHTAADAPLAATLAETGLFEPGSNEQVRVGNVAFTPQHALWTDGMSKRRWLHLPPGTAIDKSDPDRWEFPRGTRVWKEFSAQGRVETRLIERLADGSWRYASYAWNDAGTQATLAPPEGIRARGIPSRSDCLACHEGAPVPILGFSAAQQDARVIAGRTDRERAALGYLHANCGHCHNEATLGATGLALAQSAASPQVSAAKARESVATHAAEILRRVRSPNPYVRMPPIGVSVADSQSAALIEQWIQHELQPPREASR
jgi:hypothetical protein